MVAAHVSLRVCVCLSIGPQCSPQCNEHLQNQTCVYSYVAQQKWAAREWVSVGESGYGYGYLAVLDVRALERAHVAQREAELAEPPQLLRRRAFVELHAQLVQQLQLAEHVAQEARVPLRRRLPCASRRRPRASARRALVRRLRVARRLSGRRRAHLRTDTGPRDSAHRIMYIELYEYRYVRVAWANTRTP